MLYNGFVLKRTRQNKLTIYRRHAATCPTQDAKTLDQCECPLWVHGKISGKFIRTSLDTRSISTGLQRKEDLLHGRNDDDPNGGGIHVVGKAGAASGNETLEYAASEFLKANNNRATGTQILYRRAVESFMQWAAKHELLNLRDVDTTHIAKYFAEEGREWKRNTKQNRLVHLRVWFNYCCRTRRWIAFPPTQDRTLNHKAKTSSSRVPFTPAEVTSIFTATEQLPDHQRDIGRALVYLLLYTGMRISDVTFFERAYVNAKNEAEYYVIKTRKEIGMPPELQKPVLDALAKLPKTRVYFFQPDTAGDYREARTALREGEEFSSLMPDYKRRINETSWIVGRVLELAGLSGLCHRFRDTFAINLLASGADIFTVSQMLGHSDVRITQKHYMKAISGYREKMSQKTRLLSYQFPAKVA